MANRKNKLFPKGKILTLDVKDMAFGGKGIARVDTDKGEFVFFIPNTIPGQRIEARVAKSKNSFAECKLLNVIEPAPTEVENEFQAIPGAPYATLPIGEQEQLKKSTALELYKRIGHQANIEDLFDEYISSPDVWHYRNKMEYSFSCIKYDLEKKEEVDDAFALGFKHRGTWWAVENLDKDSGLFDTQLENELKNIRSFCEKSGLPAWHPPRSHGFFRFFVVRKSVVNDQLLINFVTSSADMEQFDFDGFVALLKTTFGKRLAGILHTINDETGDRVHPNNGNYRLLFGEETIQEEILGLNFNISMKSFFQTNPNCAKSLYAKTADYVMEEGRKPGVIMDLFCGTGTIGQILAKKTGEKIIGVDIVAEAIRDAKKNAEENGVSGLDFYAADVGKFLLQYPQYKGNIATIVLDPPRAGIAPKTLKKVIDLGASRIVYVSCNPATQARDTEELMQNGYVLKKISFVDQFPHTAHVEAVTLFESTS